MPKDETTERPFLKIESRDYQGRWDDAARLILSSKKIVIVIGSGISLAAGIPTFRSSSGIFNEIKSQYPKLFKDGKELFSIDVLQNSKKLEVFNSTMASLKKSLDTAKPTNSHRR